MAGQIIISNIKTDSDNAFSILANTGAVLFSANLASGITTGIADGSVTNAKLAGSITGDKVATGQITGNLIATGQITGNLLTANCVSGNNIVSSPTITGNVTINGSLGIGGATTPSSGVGIKFPGTQVASTDANTLDDYEEGTWTPVLTNGTTNVTSYFFQGGSYVKIGKQVWITIQMSVNTVGISSGNIKITGLPFTAGEIPPTGGSTAYVINGVKYFSTTGAMSLYLDRSSTELIPYFSSSYGTQMTYTDLSTGGQWWAQGYYVATA